MTSLEPDLALFHIKVHIYCRDTWAFSIYLTVAILISMEICCFIYFILFQNHNNYKVNTSLCTALHLYINFKENDFQYDNTEYIYIWQAVGLHCMNNTLHSLAFISDSKIQTEQDDRLRLISSTDVDNMLAPIPPCLTKPDTTITHFKRPTNIRKYTGSNI